MSFVELLVAIVLLGTVAVGVLAGLRATIIGTAIERDHAKSQQWLQSASEYLVNDIVWVGCDSKTGAELQTDYQNALAAESSLIPAGWQASQLTLPLAVTFGAPDGSYGTACYVEIDRQFVQIQVTDPDGEIIETVDIIKVPVGP